MHILKGGICAHFRCVWCAMIFFELYLQNQLGVRRKLIKFRIEKRSKVSVENSLIYFICVPNPHLLLPIKPKYLVMVQRLHHLICNIRVS
jgi:hypothetical protein